MCSQHFNNFQHAWMLLSLCHQEIGQCSLKNEPAAAEHSVSQCPWTQHMLMWWQSVFSLFNWFIEMTQTQSHSTLSHPTHHGFYRVCCLGDTLVPESFIPSWSKHPVRPAVCDPDSSKQSLQHFKAMKVSEVTFFSRIFLIWFDCPETHNDTSLLHCIFRFPFKWRKKVKSNSPKSPKMKTWTMPDTVRSMYSCEESYSL